MSPEEDGLSRGEGLLGLDGPPTVSSVESSHEASLSLLDGTLGLDLDTHPEYIGPSNYHEPALLDLYRPDQASRSEAGPDDPPPSSVRLARRLDDRTMFLICPDEATASEPQRIADCDAIEDSIRPLGKALVDLYFRIVHPSFPILHKGVFVAKHAVSHRMFSPPLLAAVYLIALDYQLYDAAMAGGAARPANANGQAVLEALAERTMADDLKRPKLSTLQAGLLLLQRSSRMAVESSSWVFTAQMVAVAQALGLHVDCRAWSIPEWEKGLRRRLGWALYMQDRWGALAHGRPPLLSNDSWDLQPCSPADFPEKTRAADDEDEDRDDVEGSVNTDAGRELFIRQAQLACILSDVMSRFYTSAATKPGGLLDRMGAVAAVEMAKPLVLRLREWHAGLPDELALDRIHFRRLSANASLHLAHAAVEVALHRALLRLLAPGMQPSDLVTAVRATAKARVQAAVAMLASLQPEHTAAFWGALAAHQVAAVGSLAGLLWATTDDAAETRWCAARLDELRWALRVRSQAAPFMREALRLLDGEGGRLGLVSGRAATRLES